MWKTAFKKFEVIWSATSDFLKAVFHKVYLVHSWILCPICWYPAWSHSRVKCSAFKRIKMILLMMFWPFLYWNWLYLRWYYSQVWAASSLWSIAGKIGMLILNSVFIRILGSVLYSVYVIKIQCLPHWWKCVAL